MIRKSTSPCFFNGFDRNQIILKPCSIKYLKKPMKHKRLILGLLALFLLITSMVYCYQNYGKNDPQTKKYRQLFENPETLNNTEISFLGEILAIDRTNQSLRIFIQKEPYTYPPIEINTTNVDTQNLKKGDLIDIIAVLHGKNQITATKIWLNEPWKTDLIYIRSLPAIPFVLYLFFRTWKFNTTTWQFERRKKNA